MKKIEEYEQLKEELQEIQQTLKVKARRRKPIKPVPEPKFKKVKLSVIRNKSEKKESNKMMKKENTKMTGLMVMRIRRKK